MHVLLNATKPLLLLQLHRVTYLVNFHPKQSQKSMSAFIPSTFSRRNVDCYYSIAIEKPQFVYCYIPFHKNTECILSRYSLYNITMVF